MSRIQNFQVHQYCDVGSFCQTNGWIQYRKAQKDRENRKNNRDRENRIDERREKDY